jgi:hypothetical protein
MKGGKKRFIDETGNSAASMEQQIVFVSNLVSWDFCLA